MSEPSIYGRSYWELVTHSFRKNLAARIALWVSVLMVIVAILAPVLANDRPYVFHGTMPGEYRKAFAQATRGAYSALVSLPSRLRDEQARFQKNEARLNEFLRAMTDEEAASIYEIQRELDKAAEANLSIRGRWISRDVSLSEVYELMAPEKRPVYETITGRIIRDLPSVYQTRLDDTLSGIRLKLMEMADQLDPKFREDARTLESRLRQATASGFLEGDDRKQLLQAVLDDLKATFDPEKMTLLPKTHSPALDSLKSLDVFFLVLLGMALLVFGPLTWMRLKRISPLERRWRISWTLALIPAVLSVAAWISLHETKFQTVSYKTGMQDGSIRAEWAWWPPIRYRYDEIPPPTAVKPPTAPDDAHPFGTDFMGRDLLARMIWGSQVSLSIGFVSTFISVLVGVFLGALAGFYGRWVDMGLSRIIEIMICFPVMFLILAVVAFLPPNIFYVMLVLGIFGWMGISRLTRGEFLRLVNLDFVQGALALGARRRRVMFRHILPNALGPVLVSASFGIASAMLLESALSFLGFGVMEPETSWGQILYTGRSQLDKWWTFVIPGCAIFVAVTCYNLVGDGLRDAIDPKLKT